MKEFTIVNVLQTRHDLEKNALNAVGIHGLVVPRLHQLVEVAIHVFHCNVKASAVRIQEDIQGRHKMGMRGQRAQEDDFSQLQARREGVECLLHSFDGDLPTALVRNVDMK